MGSKISSFIIWSTAAQHLQMLFSKRINPVADLDVALELYLPYVTYSSSVSRYVCCFQKSAVRGTWATMTIAPYRTGQEGGMDIYRAKIYLIL